MKKYRVHVNGKTYDVAVEDIGEVVSAAVSGPQSAAPSAPPSQPLPAGSEVIAAPMPGKVLAIKVKAGQEVREGDLILMLEAMKMENEIFCSRAGRVLEIKVAEGAYVDTGDTLVVIG
ncbi:MAG TPA: biotin/lipoyl-containing protein [Syntrophales bacterium]